MVIFQDAVKKPKKKKADINEIVENLYGKAVTAPV